MVIFKTFFRNGDEFVVKIILINLVFEIKTLNAIKMIFLIFFFIKQIKNKNLYTKFLTRFRLGTVFPAPYLAAVILSYMLISVSICPFGTVFGLLLPRFMDVHLEILKQINNDAEM